MVEPDLSLPDIEIVSVTRTSDDDYSVEVESGDMDPHLALGLLVMGVVEQVNYLVTREEEEEDD